MLEFELFLNKKHNQIRQAVLCIGPNYPDWRLKEVVDRTDLDKLIVTGFFTEEQSEKMTELLKINAACGKQKLPAVFECYPLNRFTRPEGEYAMLVDALEDNQDVLLLKKYTPDYLLGEIQGVGTGAFEIWNEFRSFCKHIQLVTLRGALEPQVLDWEKDPENEIELSVILPMYNVAKYLDKCIQSVTAWKADYIEFLFVNDGSPDNSREIVLEYAKKDPRIKLLDKPNGGCASARQWGLDRAKGRYIGFIDPDDFIDESMYRKLLRAAMTGSYDISYCGYKEYYENTGMTMEAPDTLGAPYNTGCAEPRRIQELITYARVAIWRGIYKLDMLKENNIHFYTEIRRFDDLPFKVETFAVARSVITVEEYLYYYRLARPGQDVAADDERLYVHFPIFAHLNDSVAGKKDPRMTDYLQLCKIQTHRYALEKIRPEFVKEYARQAREDLSSTGSFWRSYFLIKKMVGKKSAAIYWAIMRGNTMQLKKLCNK